MYIQDVHLETMRMAKKTLTVSEARKSLPQLIREVARGGGPFYLGARGQPEAVLISVAELSALERNALGGGGVVGESLDPWESLRLEILGDPDDLIKDIREIRAHAVTSTVESWDRLMAQATPPRKRARPKVARR